MSDSTQHRVSAPAAPGLEALRHLSLERYGLAGLGGGRQDQDVEQIAVLAQQLLQADFGVINIVDGSRLVPIAGSPGVVLDPTARSFSLCHWVVQSAAGPQAFLCSDATTEPTLAASPWVTGALDAVRFYAAAPLIGREGVALGTLCVWSRSTAETSSMRQSMLEHLAERVVDKLDQRRNLIEALPPAGSRPRETPPTATVPQEPLSSPVAGAPSTPAPPAAGSLTIDAVIRDRAIRTVFQPIVHLQSGEVVGFEALSRGPANSALESPAVLIESARVAGRLGELDWLCRARAMESVSASGLHPSLSWFINVEPAGLEIPCPDYLMSSFAQARTDLRVVLEVVERDVEGQVTKLLHATDQARNDAWGVALDDVGGEESSLALLHFLQPDVVKLDMSLVRNVDRRAAARITAAVRAYAERRGAVVLAEGIETEEQERLAQAFGATYGQGYRYGAAAPLPETVAAPRAVIPLRQRPEPLGGGSPFDILSAARTPERAAKQDLRHITANLEEHAIEAHEAGVVLAGLQDARFFGTGQQERYRLIAERNALTVVLGQDVGDVAEPRYRTASLLPGSAVQRDWLMIVLTPYFAAAFAARDCGDEGPEDERRFDYVYTHDPDLVITAGRSFLQELEDGPVAGWFGNSSDAVLTSVGAVVAGGQESLPTPRAALRAFGRRHR